jgi:hypothetical protein
MAKTHIGAGWIQPKYTMADFIAKVDLGLLIQASADKTLDWVEEDGLRKYSGSGWAGFYNRQQIAGLTYVDFELHGPAHWTREEVWRGEFCVKIVSGSENPRDCKFYRYEQYRNGQFNGDQQWRWKNLSVVEHYLAGQLHCVDGPAIDRHTTYDTYHIWYQFGQRHRDDGRPAVYRGRMKKYYRFGQLHRIGGPAIDYRKSANNIHIQYWRNGQLVPGPNGTAVAYRKGQRACVVSQTNGVWRVRFSIGPRHHVISAPTAVLHYKAAANPAAHRASKYVTAGPHPVADYPVATIGGVSSYYVGTTLLYDGHVRVALFDLLPVCIAREIDAILATVARITV